MHECSWIEDCRKGPAMGLAQLLRLAISTSILLLVFALGIGATFEQATSVLRRPSRLVPALLAIFVIVPAFAALLAKAFDLPAPAEIGMLAMAVSPVPPILPGKQLKFGGRADPRVLREELGCVVNQHGDRKSVV